MTDELLALADWLAEAGVTHVAMESTGIYWKPVYNVLEGSFTRLVVNAHHIKAVPGRKTDVKDAEWIADLLRHGLLRGSFVPERCRRGGRTGEGRSALERGTDGLLRRHRAAFRPGGGERGGVEQGTRRGHLTLIRRLTLRDQGGAGALS